MKNTKTPLINDTDILRDKNTTYDQSAPQDANHDANNISKKDTAAESFLEDETLDTSTWSDSSAEESKEEMDDEDYLNKGEKHLFQTDVSNVLKIVTHSLYSNPQVFFRELLANAADACYKLQMLSVTNPDLHQEDYHITIETTPTTLTIRDNGIGMTEEELTANLGNIASSGTKKFLQSFNSDQTISNELVGQFGVGFYAAFMVADEVIVESKSAVTKGAHRWSSKGAEDFFIRIANKQETGTEVTLILKPDQLEFTDINRIKSLLELYGKHLGISIFLKEQDKESELFSESNVFWRKNKQDITEADYNKFFEDNFYLRKPFAIIHKKTEGSLEYTALLAVPSIRDYQMLEPKEFGDLTLYSKRMLISKESKLLPGFLCFVSGLVECDDLDLNIRRELLQSHELISKIRNHLTKQVLNELRQVEDNYIDFFQKFGIILKEGLCGSNNYHDQIFDACRFYTYPDKKWIRLSEYKEENYYYLVAPNLHMLEISPYLENLKISQVIILQDAIDDYWVKLNLQHNNKRWLSVVNAKDIRNEAADSNTTPANLDQLLQVIKDTLTERVDEKVEVVNHLTSSLFILLDSNNSQNDQLMQMLQLQGIKAPATPYKLGINPQHPLTAKLCAKLEADEDISNDILVAFNMTLLAHGKAIENMAEFNAQVLNLLSK